MWKKYTSVCTLILLVFHLAGSYVYFAVRLGEVRMTMREKLAELPDHQLEIVDVPLAAFQTEWLEEREMKWSGKMYDIARTVTLGETVRVFCLHDEDEDGWLNFLSAVTWKPADRTPARRRARLYSSFHSNTWVPKQPSSFARSTC